MAVLIDINYTKKLGLPNYSSHSLGIGLKAEAQDLDGVRGEGEKVYGLLQESVDAQLARRGFIPGETGNGKDLEGGTLDDPPGTEEPDFEQTDPESWQCSPKQRTLILDILGRHDLQSSIVDAIAWQIHGRSMMEVTPREASAVVGEILERFGKRSNGGNPRDGRGRS